MTSEPSPSEDQRIRSVACLRFFGDDLDPDEITSLLGHAPSESFRRGDIETFSSGRSRTHKTGGWLLEHSDGEGDFNAHIAELLAPLTQDLSIWQSLAARYQQPDIFCGFFMNKSSCGPNSPWPRWQLSPAVASVSMCASMRPEDP